MVDTHCQSSVNAPCKLKQLASLNGHLFTQILRSAFQISCPGQKRSAIFLSVSSPTKSFPVFSHQLHNRLSFSFCLSVAAPAWSTSTHPPRLSSALLLLENRLRHYLWSQRVRRLRAPDWLAHHSPHFTPLLFIEETFYKHEHWNMLKANVKN